jgi:penicillin-insensitive murein DD-endopeptidase
MRLWVGTAGILTVATAAGLVWAQSQPTRPTAQAVVSRALPSQTSTAVIPDGPVVPRGTIDPDAIPEAPSAPQPGVAPPTAPAAGATPKKQPVAAKVLFGAVKTPAPMEARAVGFYSKGCLAGATAVPVDGPAWQVMRLSRNRNWGHPVLTRWVERFARDVQSLEGWPGLLVGDLSQPRGGPMLTGHASHQIGLDADLWLTPMPNRRLSNEEREDLAATSMLPGGNEKSIVVDPAVWTDAHVRLIRRAANYSEVERILVHPAIKKALCDAAPALGPDRAWLWKVRPFWGHHYHMHVRMGCPPNSPGCQGQAATIGDDGCGKELSDWQALISRPDPPKPKVPVEPKVVVKPPPPKVTLDTLPAECRVVLGAYANGG